MLPSIFGFFQGGGFLAPWRVVGQRARAGSGARAAFQRAAGGQTDDRIIAPEQQRMSVAHDAQQRDLGPVAAVRVEARLDEVAQGISDLGGNLDAHGA